MSAKRQHWPTADEERALELGADELIERLEWLLRDRPTALRKVRDRYRNFCTELYRRLEKARS